MIKNPNGILPLKCLISMLYDSGFVLIKLIHGLNLYINYDLSVIVYGSAKISAMCNEIT